MTVDEYNAATGDILNKDRPVERYIPPDEVNMEYVPQPIYKLVRYNSPPGAPELKMSTKLKFDRKFVCPGIVSPQKDIIVYPVVYYYAENQCSSGELHVIPLDKNLPVVERVLLANTIKENQTPILETEKDISEKFILRTMTPIDFCEDASLLVAKEKVGNINDGVWQTDIWVYNFRSNKAIKLPEIRQAIKYYWFTHEGIQLDDKRWDIYPLGFKKLTNEVVVSAYAFTGDLPRYLGTWSTDLKGENVKLLSIDNVNVKIQQNGLKLEKAGYEDPSVVHNQSLERKKEKKKKAKLKKKEELLAKKNKKKELNKKLKKMRADERKILRHMH